MIFHYKQTPIYYEQLGSGPALVLIHGFLESSIMFEKCKMEFAKTRTVITIDLPGHGKSEVLESIHSMELFAEVVHALLAHLNIHNATFLGHSMGGYVALALAEKNPEIIEKLILLNSTTEADSEDRKRNRNRAIAMIDSHAASYIRMAIINLFSEKARLDYSSEIETQINQALSFPKKGIIAAIAGMRDRKDRLHVLSSLGKPKYIVAGIEDPLISVSEAEVIADRSNSEKIILDSGHMSLTENYGETVKILHLIV